MGFYRFLAGQFGLWTLKESIEEYVCHDQSNTCSLLFFFFKEIKKSATATAKRTIAILKKTIL